MKESDMKTTGSKDFNYFTFREYCTKEIILLNVVQNIHFLKIRWYCNYDYSKCDKKNHYNLKSRGLTLLFPLCFS